MPAILQRLRRQLAAKGDDPDMAAALLKKNGILNDKGKLTAKGKRRQALGPAGRAKSRAAKYNGGKPSDYKYSPKTNRATKAK